MMIVSSGRGGVALKTYVEELDVVQDLVVEREVVGGDDVGTGILLELPVGGTESGSDGDELLLGDLAGPVGLGGLLELAVGSHAGEPEDGSGGL